jgi:hypothetical protein
MIRDDAAMGWWNKLTREQRLAVASELPKDLPQPESGSDWTLPWERLLPFTQQMRLQLYHRLIVVRRFKNR